MAANAPKAMDAIDTKTTICCHSTTRPPNGPIMTRMKSASAAILGATEKKAVTGVGAPSYTSGVHMWNGTADTLKASPARMKTMPKMMPILISVSPPRKSWASWSKSVVPVKP